MGTMFEFCIKKNDQRINRIKSEEPNWRPLYHVYPKIGWCNDPNGFCYYKGEYHLFYQYNPYDSSWGQIHWGHVKSKNLIDWERLPIALTPDNYYDRNGCFSGSGIEGDDKLYIIYTGNVDIPKHVQYQNMAFSENGINFVKYDENPVINKAPVITGQDISIEDFRDPKMWKHDDTYYCLVGSRNTTTPSKGQVCLFESSDLKKWEFKSVMLKSPENIDIGYMWECPTFESLNNEKDIFICSPQGVKPVGNKFLNKHQSVYFLGKLDYEKGLFEYNGFELLDFGFDFYAPQTITGPDGRKIMIAWLSMWESEWPEKPYGWCGMMTIPREITLENGKIYTRPIKEMDLLRDRNKNKKVSYSNISFQDNPSFDNIYGVCFIMDIELDMSQSTELYIKFCVSYSEELVLKYEKNSKLLKLNRDKSKCIPKGEREAPLELENNKLKFNIFMDNSALEIYAQDGLIVMTSRIYPDDDSNKIIFESKGKATIQKLDFYPIDN